MMPSYVALTALSGQIRHEELAAVAKALQTQVTRDFLPEWGSNAIVVAVSSDALPAGTVPLIVHDTLDPAADGYHCTRDDDMPYIVVPYGPTWSLAASHELLRMLANPTGSARMPGPSRLHGQGTVDYLLDVCAPCQDVSASYAIDGMPVSDFCTRRFFAAAGAGGSFTGQLRQAFEPIANGIVTWLADDGLLYQARADPVGRVRVHGGFSPANRGRLLLRELVDMLTPDRLPALSNAPRTPCLLEAEQNARRARMAHTMRFRDDIAWRFAAVPAEARVAEPLRQVHRVVAVSDPVARAASNDVKITVRSAS